MHLTAILLKVPTGNYMPIDKAKLIIIIIIIIIIIPSLIVTDIPQ